MWCYRFFVTSVAISARPLVQFTQYSVFARAAMGDKFGKSRARLRNDRAVSRMEEPGFKHPATGQATACSFPCHHPGATPARAPTP